MKLTYADTKLIKEKGKDIVDLSTEYNSIITNFFKKITNFPYDTKAWIGNPAEQYAELVSLDKQQYIDFANAIKVFGNKIINAAESIDACIKTSNNGDSYKG